nr:MAG TPA: Serine/threonine-protein kinase [Caudoviricetes sp.]
MFVRHACNCGRTATPPVGAEPVPLADGTLPGSGSKDSSPITRF